jgi:hypothetical protein
MLYLMTIRYLNNPVTGQGDFLFPVGNDEIVDTAMLYLMTIRYLNSPVTGQGDFLWMDQSYCVFFCADKKFQTIAKKKTSAQFKSMLKSIWQLRFSLLCIPYKTK